MKRAEIIVKGKVQRVGYRDTVEDIAVDTKITGFSITGFNRSNSSQSFPKKEIQNCGNRIFRPSGKYD